MEYLLDMWPLLLGLAAIIGAVYWSQWRDGRREDEAHAQALAAFAATFGGTVVTHHPAPWSASLLPPFQRHTDGVIGLLTTVRRPRFSVAVEFQRGPWRVRISEAWMRKRTKHGRGRQRSIYEHRIDVATAELAPLKISRRWHTDFRGQPLNPDHILAKGGKPVTEPPATVAQRQGPWAPAAVSAPANQDLAAYTCDHAAAARMLNAHSTAWLLDRLHALPPLLTFESCLLYATMPGRIDPSEVMQTVDTLLGLLDCVPASAPIAR